jgi:hypothetical protein
MKLSALVVAVLFVAAPTFAADIDGTWTGTVSTPMGEAPVEFQFKADGAMLTGTALAPDGSHVAIKNGKIDGNTITYTASFDLGGMTFEFIYKGTVAKNEIMLTAEFMGMPFEFVVKKKG